MFDSIEEIKKAHGSKLPKWVSQQGKMLLKTVNQAAKDIDIRERKNPLTYKQRCGIFHRIQKNLKTHRFSVLQVYLAYNSDERFFNKLNKFFIELHEEVYQKAVVSPLYFDFLYSEICDFDWQFFTFGYTIEDYDSALKSAIRKKITGWSGYWMIDFSSRGAITNVWGSGTSDFDAVYDAFFKEPPYRKIHWKVPTRKNYRYKKEVEHEIGRIKRMIRKDPSELRAKTMRAYVRKIEVEYKLK